jgi:hypothetical protein
MIDDVARMLSGLKSKPGTKEIVAMRGLDSRLTHD